jgi:hypothetical protein
MLLPEKGGGKIRNVECDGTRDNIMHIISPDCPDKANHKFKKVECAYLIGKSITLHYDKTAEEDQLFASKFAGDVSNLKGNVLLQSREGKMDIVTLRKLINLMNVYGLFVAQLKEQLTTYVSKRKKRQQVSRREIFAIVKDVSNAFPSIPHDDITWENFNTQGNQQFSKLGF